MSHLGKYVPGKAMVVVLRSGLVVPYGGRAGTAAIATFYETLVMMCAGGLVAAAGFAGGPKSATVELMLWSGAGWRFPFIRSAPYRAWCWPWGFSSSCCRRCSARGGCGGASHPRGGARRCAAHLTRLALCQGLFWSSGGWILLGLSQLAVIRSFDPRGAIRLLRWDWRRW